MEEVSKVGETINANSITETEVLGRSFSIYGDLENPLFMAKDVANWIGMSNVTDMISRVDEDEVTKLNLGGLQGECNMLTENGLYEVLMQSRKPIAKSFKKEVKKVLHELRTKGEVRVNYDIPQTYSQALMLAANQAKQIEEQNKLIEEQKPKADFYDAVTGSKDAIDMALCAKTLNMGIGRNRLFDFLRTRLVLDRNNIPYQKFIDRGYFRTIEQKYTKPDGTTCINIKTVVYQKGMEYIRNLIENAGR